MIYVNFLILENNFNNKQLIVKNLDIEQIWF